MLLKLMFHMGLINVLGIFWLIIGPWRLIYRLFCKHKRKIHSSVDLYLVWSWLPYMVATSHADRGGEVVNINHYFQTTCHLSINEQYKMSVPIVWFSLVLLCHWCVRTYWWMIQKLHCIEGWGQVGRVGGEGKVNNFGIWNDLGWDVRTVTNCNKADTLPWSTYPEVCHLLVQRSLALSAVCKPFDSK